MPHRDHRVQERESALQVALETSSTLPWYQIEQAAFREHPEVLVPGLASQQRSSLLVKVWRVIVTVVSLILVVFAPMFSYIVIVDSRYQVQGTDYATMIPVSAVLSSVTFLCLLGSLIRWIVKGRLKSWAVIGYALYCLVFSVLAALIITARGSNLELPDWELWRVPALACIAMFVITVLVYLLMVVRVSGVNTVAELPAKVQETLAGRRRRFAMLSDEEREAITADLTAAIDVVEERRLIDAPSAARARGAEPGGLEIWMRY